MRELEQSVAIKERLALHKLWSGITRVMAPEETQFSISVMFVIKAVSSTMQ